LTAGVATPIESGRDICYRVPEDFEHGVGASSECVPGMGGLVSECADDFVIDSGGRITHVTWWGTFFCNPPPYDGVIQSFDLRFYDDRNCLPGDLLAEIHIPNDCNQTLVHEDPTFQFFRYDADVSFSPAAGQRYWFSAQTCEHRFPPQWGRLTATEVQGCEGAFRSAYFGLPNWTPASDVFGISVDFAVEIECETVTIARQTSWGGVRALFR
jgi:hypothetical protein